MLFLALAVPATYLFARPSLEEMAKLRWLDDIGVAISTSLAAKPQAVVPAVDPIAAAKVDEDLDYRIAERTKSTEGWRAFLAAHPDGPHAQSARAELDKLAPPMTPAAPAAAQAPDTGAADTKIPSEVVSPPPPSAGTETARVASDEICKRRRRPFGTIVQEPDKRRNHSVPDRDALREAAAATRPPGRKPRRAAARGYGRRSPTLYSASISPEPAVSAIDSPLPPRRAAEPPNKPRLSVVSRGLQPRRRASASTAPSLPPILLALFGEHPKSSATFRRTRAGGRVGANSTSGSR